MIFHSTRNPQNRATLHEAILQGLVPDGGLFVPAHFPKAAWDKSWNQLSESKFAHRVLEPWFADESLPLDLRTLCDESLNFPWKIKKLKGGPSILELFHGPTLAFKDVGARFLAAYLTQTAGASAQTSTVLVATSGDTGGAVASAFYQRPQFDVKILFPLGKVSKRQQMQLTTWGKNISAYAVKGSFDDCQRMVKETLHENKIKVGRNFVSANSINLGRLLPQMTYYAYSSVMHWTQRGVKPNYYIPTGNLGNAVSCLWAREMGFPIGKVTFCTNANRAIPNYFESSIWQGLPTIPTIANAMDVGQPSNMERLLDLLKLNPGLRAELQAQSVLDSEIKTCIQDVSQSYHEVLCPHTAVAFKVWQAAMDPDAIVVATAHPAKFEEIVEPLIGRELPIPQELQLILGGTENFTNLEPQASSLWAKM